MKYLRIVTAFTGACWAIQKEKYLEMRDFLVFKAAGGEYGAAEVAERIGARVNREVTSPSAVAVIPVVGIISQRMGNLDDISGPGGASTERIAKDFRTALSDPSVSAIVLDVDSPGGTVFGVAELAAEIFKARGKKPIVAVANSLAASAAYWIASAAEEFDITPSGEAGSIGVFAEHTDISKWLENEGIKPTLISAGEYKVEANSYQPLQEEAASFIQSRVNDYYDMFLEAVAKYRGISKTKVKADFGQGRVFGAEQAVAAGMVDKIATFDQVLRRLGTSQAVSKAEIAAPAPAAEAAEEEEPDLEKLLHSRELEIEQIRNVFGL